MLRFHLHCATLIWLLWFSLLSFSEAVCPGGWEAYGDNCYIFYASAISRNACYSTCTSAGGMMLCINNAAENAYIWGKAVSKAGYIWLGLNDVQIEGNFVWEFGCSSTYWYWYPTNPNNSGGVEDHVALAAADGTWYDVQETMANTFCGCQTYYAPTTNPTASPTTDPTLQPTPRPSASPTRNPTSQPSSQPSRQPSAQPNSRPTSQPSRQPSSVPTCQPSRQPSSKPTSQPSGRPSSQPSAQPSSHPSRQPTGQPSRQPSSQPSTQPTRQPSAQPTTQPSVVPTGQPSSAPTRQPSLQPSRQPSSQPSRQPSGRPSSQPSAQPSRQPSAQPSGRPTMQPFATPTTQPSSQPSVSPTAQPSGQPTCQPSQQPSSQPTAQPSEQPSVTPSAQPTTDPTSLPTSQPSIQPSQQPSAVPSSQPSALPTVQPSSEPSQQPSSEPSAQPSGSPTTQPSTVPSAQPTSLPSMQPSQMPTSQPSSLPSSQPSSVPTDLPSSQPSSGPTSVPSSLPSSQPSSLPSVQPSDQPSATPSTAPSSIPTSLPSVQPTSEPSVQPSADPSVQSSATPSTAPSAQPSGQPSSAPSPKPSPVPTATPTHAPSVFDAAAPVVRITTAERLRTAVNTEQRISLTGSVSTKTPCTAVWTANNAIVVLEEVALTPLSMVVSENTVPTTIHLVLAPNALPVRSTLLFVLTCGKSASATMVTTNGPPLAGVFTTLPAAGVELTTSFSLSVSGWTDADLPLNNQFGFVSPSSGVFLVLLSKSSTNATTAMLPAGASTALYHVQTIVQVFDSLGASANASCIVTVKKQVSPAALQTSILNLLSNSAGNTDATKGAISVGATALNTVSCDGAPDCAGLNRVACATVENTCGECLSGYIGDVGASNSVCLSPATIKLSASSVRPCVSNADCSSWEQCDVHLAFPVCALPSKTCPGDCSDHGACTFVNTNSLKAVGDCKSNMPTCEAVCVCTADFFGASCNVSSATHSVKQTMRAQLISGLSGVTSSEEPTSASVSSWASALTELTQDATELSKSAVAATNALSLSIVASARAVSGVSHTAVVGALNSLDAATSASATADATVAGDVVLSVVSQFSDLVTSQLVVGENAVDLIYDNFRSTSMRWLAASGSVLNISAPQTFTEQSGDLTSPSASIDLGAGDEEEVTVSFISTVASAYGAQGGNFTSNPLRLLISRNLSATTNVTLVLVNNEAVQYTNATEAASLGFNSTCTGLDDTSVHYFTCPLSGSVLMHNCTGLAGVLRSYCPVRGPACNVRDPASGVFVANSSVCSVVQFDEYSTTCACTIASSTSRRRLSGDALDQSGILDVATATAFLGNSFANTFHASSQLTSAAGLQRVLIVIVMFSTLWAGGLLLIFGCAWRRKVMGKVNAKEQTKLERKMQSAQVSRSPAAVRQYLADYVTETLPSVFSSKPFFSRCFGEVKRHHRYLTLFTAPEGPVGDKERVLTCVELLSVQTMLMFLLALLYDVQGPSDDGSCPFKLSATECVRRRSPFDSSQSYCEWALHDTGGYSCMYQNPTFTLQVVIYIGVMVALLVALISYPVDRLFELLSAPEADELKIANDPGLVQRAVRRASNVARRVSAVASNLASAAHTTTRKILAGSETRKIPESTEAAHALATASMTVIAANSQQFLMNRQLSRVRAYYESGGKFGASGRSDASDSDSSDSDSNSESDDGAEKRPVRSRSSRHMSETDRTASNESKSSSDTTDEVVVTFRKLEEEVLCQRRLLRTAELEVFDFQWGMDPSGDFTRSEKTIIPCIQGKPGSQELITKELRYVKAETTKRADKLRNATDQHTGLEILHLFIIDLLGRNTSAARIFEIKSAEDFKHTKVVTRTSKRLAMLAIVALNAFFVYYAMLTGYQRGLSWQRVYLYACIVQFFVEIFLFETMECVWVNCAVPILVSSEVRQVNESIVAVVQSLCAGAATVEPRFFLNAPDYLFVSTNVAKKFPALMESILVQAYASHIPGELAKTWQVGSIARIQRHHRLRRTTLLGVMLGALQYMGTAPFIFHRMFVRAVQPFVLSGLVMLWRLIITDWVSIVASVVVLVAICAAAVYWRRRERLVLERAAVSKVMVEYVDDDVDAGINAALPPIKDLPSHAALHQPAESLHSDVSSAVVTTRANAPHSPQRRTRGQKMRAECKSQSLDSQSGDEGAAVLALTASTRSRNHSRRSHSHHSHHSHSHAKRSHVHFSSDKHEPLSADSISVVDQNQLLVVSEGSASVSDSSVSSSDDEEVSAEVHVRSAHRASPLK